MIELTMSGKFSILKDIELEKAGTHFFCSACVISRPLSEQSENPKYCKACYEIIKAEKQITKRQPKNLEDLPIFSVKSPNLGGSKVKQVKSVVRKK